MNQVITICLWLVQVVLRPEQTKGFGTLKKRWVVERMVGWLMHCRRLVHDIGLQLGAIWEEQTVHLPLAGNLVRVKHGVYLYMFKLGTWSQFALHLLGHKLLRCP
jgi:hypothetical protein